MGKLVIFMTALVLLSACQVIKNTVIHETVEDLTDSEIYSGGNCILIKRECSDGSYREWKTPKGVTMCACDK